MVRLIDDQIGKVLDTLAREGFCEDTLVLFVSDHGDMLGDHYRIQKGVPWRQAMNVPLAIRLPGAAPIGRSDAPVEISDLAATILEYAGMDTAALSRAWPAYHDRIPSRSLLPILEGRTAVAGIFATAKATSRKSACRGRTGRNSMPSAAPAAGGKTRGRPS